VVVLFQFFPDSDSEIISKIGKYLIKLRRTKKLCRLFGPHCIVLFIVCLYTVYPLLTGSEHERITAFKPEFDLSYSYSRCLVGLIVFLQDK